jgi:hypothetical protein
MMRSRPHFWSRGVDYESTCVPMPCIHCGLLRQRFGRGGDRFQVGGRWVPYASTPACAEHRQSASPELRLVRDGETAPASSHAAAEATRLLDGAVRLLSQPVVSDADRLLAHELRLTARALRRRRA